ncbi:MAG: hypothetical protein KIT14_12410 [bacterium]|nr:hypothetical protein [bacterium]
MGNLPASESLTWYSAFGGVASTTCVLLALGRVAGRRVETLGRRVWLVVFAWLVLGDLFFGTALPVALVLPAVVAIAFPATPQRRAAVRAALAVAGGVALVHLGLQWVATTAFAAAAVQGAELRWLLHGLEPAARSFAALLRSGVTSLLLGAWWSPVPGSAATAWIALGVAAAGSLAVLGLAPAPRWFAACVLVALAVYAAVAASRGPLLVGLLGQEPAEIGATLRYHYASQAFLAVAACIGLTALLARSPGTQAVVACGVAAVLLAGTVRRPVPLELHELTRRRVTEALTALRVRIALTPPGQTASIGNRQLPGLGWMPNTTAPLPGLAALFVIAFPSDAIDGRRVRFVEHDLPTYWTFTARPGRLADVLAPDELFGGPPAVSPLDTAASRLQQH